MSGNTVKWWGAVKDPIHGYIHLTLAEKCLVDTPAVQRLRRIRQLAGVEYVFPAANHSRFEHVLGAMHLAGEFVESLPVGLGAGEKEEVRIAALLHDVGHAPFSHMFEPFLRKYFGKDHEDMSRWVIAESALADELERQGQDPRRISALAVGRLEGGGRPYLNGIISGPFDVDKMDFVLRDSYHAGARYGSIDVARIINKTDVIDGKLAVDVSALPALESLVVGRLESFRAIYFHRASRAVQILLGRAISAAGDDIGLRGIRTADDYLRWDDYTLWVRLKENAKSAPFMEKLEARRLPKCAYERTFVGESRLSGYADEAARAGAEAEIARRAGITADAVTIDMPSLTAAPYLRSKDINLANVPLFTRTGDRMVRAEETELPRIIDAIQTFANIIRVYGPEEARRRVSEAAVEVLGAGTARPGA